MTLHRVTNGERELCSECYRKDLPLGNIVVPYACFTCGTKPSPDRRNVCKECLEKIRDQHKIEYHRSIDLV